MSVIKENNVLSIVLANKEEINRGKCFLCREKDIKKTNYTANNKIILDSITCFFKKDKTADDICNACSQSINGILRSEYIEYEDTITIFDNPKLPNSVWFYRSEYYNPIFYNEVKELDKILDEYYNTHTEEVDWDGLPKELDRQVDIIYSKVSIDIDMWDHKHIHDCTHIYEIIEKSNFLKMSNDIEFIDFISTRFILNLFNREQTAIKHKEKYPHYYK